MTLYISWSILQTTEQLRAYLSGQPAFLNSSFCFSKFPPYTVLNELQIDDRRKNSKTQLQDVDVFGDELGEVQVTATSVCLPSGKLSGGKHSNVIASFEVLE